MHIIVLGAGVIGVTTAYYLSKSGYNVTVLDRQPGVALETSFANAGQITPGYSSPWAAPGVPFKALKWMFQPHAPLSIQLTGQKFQYEWMLKMLGQCNAERYQINKERMLRLSEHSRTCFDHLREEIEFGFDARQLGTLQIFRTQQQLDAIEKDIQILTAENIPHQLLTAEALLNVEPALKKSKVNLVGGLHLLGDQTGDCHKFTVELAKLCEKRGVNFIFNANIQQIQKTSNTISGVLLKDGQLIQGDQYVIALGSFSRDLLAQIDLKLPVYPLKGYSITTPITDPDAAPISTILDESYKVALTRFDDRIRVGGMAEICGFNRYLDPRREHTLKMVLKQLFPEASDSRETLFWTGFRPSTPDGTPIIGKTQYQNLLTNTGHGTLGWTMSCGSAQLLTDIISNRATAIRTDDLNFSRYV